MKQYIYIDLSHTIEDGLVTYKGLPAPIICDYLSREKSAQFYEEGTTFQIGKIEMVTNTGTYIDCPFHRYADGKDLSEMSIERFIDIPMTLIHIPYQETIKIDKKMLEGYQIEDRAVIIHTGWDVHWNTESYYENGPYLTEDAAIYLRDNCAKLVGIDAHNIDDTSGTKRPVHTVLLGAEILIVEHLCNIDKIPNNLTECSFTAAPPKIKGAGTFPVRAYVTYSV